MGATAKKKSTYEQRLTDLFITAYEGGSSYWASVHISFGEKAQEKIKEMGSTSEYLFSRIWNDGKEFTVFDAEEGDELGKMNKANFKKGYTLLKSDPYVDHYSDLVSENWDANTADVWFQLAILNDITFC